MHSKNTLCLAALVLLLCALFSGWALANTGNAEPQHLEGWEYRWGDSPFSEEGPLWTLDAEPEAWHAIDFPSNPPNRQGQELVWYRVELPENHWQDPVIYIYSIDLLAEVYLGNEKIYAFGEINDDGRGRFAGWPWHQLELPENFAGQSLYFRVFSDYTDIGLWGEVLLIERADLLLKIIATSWFDLLVILFCLLVTLLAFTFSAMQTGARLAFIYLGLLVLTAAGKLLGENQAVQLVLDAPLFRTYLAAISYFILPVFIYLLIQQWLPQLPSRLGFKVALGHLGYALLALVASLLGWVQLSITYPVFDFIFTLSLVLLVYLTARHYQQLDLDERLVMLAFWILAIFLLVDMAVAHSFLPWGRFPLSLGVLIFAFTLFVLALREYQHSQKQILELNATLEERIQQRTASLQTYAQLERERSHQLNKLREDFQRLSYEDALTGLKNRRYLDEALEREVSLAKRQKTPLALLMCDLDHFKAFNDTHGHAAGDEALRNLAGVFLEHFRETDLPCRFGGEEFVIIMPGASKATALARATELLKKLASQHLVYQGKDLGNMTLSVGIASWPDTALDAASLLRAADQALYQAKQKGRNRVEMANDKGA